MYSFPPSRKDPFLTNHQKREPQIIIPDPPNGVECTGDSGDPTTIGGVVGNLLGCGGIGGILGGK
jgi:hypothetical protein